jgi:glycosyltransferase involved in cell wall biosynthesis
MMRLTVITPSYGQAAYLEECLRSVAAQQHPHRQHIVVDGGSTDGSRQLIEAHAGALAWWCSEPDKGQSHAINKGLAHATGHAFTWVNSDDALLPGAMARVAEAFAADPALLVFGGRVLHRDAHGDKVFAALNDPAEPERLFRDPVINQPATWYRTDMVQAIGGVDAALRYVMDVELWWQVLFRHGTQHLRFEPLELAMFRLHDASKTVAQHAGFLDELAGLLHGMCRACGLQELAAVLELGHKLPNGLRGLPVTARHRAEVKGMALHFLLKWHGLVHRREQFHMMRLLKRNVKLDGIAALEPRLLDRWKALDRQVDTASWAAFRLRRKWRALRP